MNHSQAAGPVDTRISPHSVWRTLPFAAARITDGFWARQRQTNRQVSLRHGYAMLERVGNLPNLRLAAGQAAGAYTGRNFSDETVYKWLEGLAWELGNGPDTDLQRMADEVIALVVAAQQPDGYLNSYYTVVEPEVSAAGAVLYRPAWPAYDAGFQGQWAGVSPGSHSRS